MARTSRKKKETLPITKGNNYYQAGFYLRLSEKDQGCEVSESIHNQKELLLDFIHNKPDIHVKKIYTDDGKSGTNFDRPGFMELMEDVKKGIINCIVVKDLSRFGRNYLETGNYIETIFPLLNVRFIAVTDHFDTLTTSQSEIAYLLPLKNMMNENYARDISIKEKTAKAALRKRGSFSGAAAVYGYVKSEENKHKLAIDPEAAKIIQLIFDMAEQAYSDIAIAKHLNEQGIDCPATYKFKKGYTTNRQYENAKYWYKQTIARITTSEIYIGNMVQGVRLNQEIRGKKRAMNKKDWDIVEGTHEAIIPAEQFNRVQKIREARKEKYLQYANASLAEGNEENIFKGLLICGDCKKAMMRSKVKNCNDPYRFKCNTYEGTGGCIKKYLREGDLINTINTVLRSRIELALDVNQKLEEIEDNKELKRFNQELNTLKNEHKRIVNLKSLLHKDLKSGILDEQEYRYMKNKYELQMIKYQERMEELNLFEIQHIEKRSPEIPAIRQLFKFCENKNLSSNILNALIAEIKVYDKDRISIHFKF